jgi:ATPase subunit of ABC transporter with duplicated ATPase domains
MNKKFALKVNKISKSFDQKVVLDEVSFSLFFGQKVALIGANGSGKSTLAKIIIKKIKADSGEIEIFKNFLISYLPQEMNEEFLVEEYLEKNSKAFEILESFGLEEEIFRRKISSLSGGEKTKIFLIKIALEKSPIIILDEPTNNLDQDGLEFLEKIIQKSNSAFLIVSHDRAFLDKTVSKILFLDENSHQLKIYDGNYSDFFEIRKREIKRQEEL